MSSILLVLAIQISIDLEENKDTGSSEKKVNHHSDVYLISFGSTITKNSSWFDLRINRLICRSGFSWRQRGRFFNMSDSSL